MGELARCAKTDEIELEQLPVTPQQIVELQQLVDDGKINDKIARQVLDYHLLGKKPAQPAQEDASAPDEEGHAHD
mgnify:CR=1 FL=1